MIHIEGFLANDDYHELHIKGSCYSLPEMIQYRIINETNNSYDKENNNDNNSEENINVSMLIPKVSLRIFFSDIKCSLDEAINNQILASIGALDILQYWYGYSEYTIEALSIEKFQLISNDGGKHDLKQIFNNYIGKYVHILIEIFK